MTCRCESCSKEPLPTYTEKFKHESFVRQVSGFDKYRMAEFAKIVKKDKGYQAWLKIRADILKMRNNNK